VTVTAPTQPHIRRIPAARADRYRRDGLWRGTTVMTEVLAAVAAAPPDRPALVTDESVIRYGDVADRVRAHATALAGRGLGAGDRAVVQLPNSPDLVLTLLGLWYLGAVPVTALPAHRTHDLDHICRASGAAALITPERSRRVDHRAFAAERDLAWIHVPLHRGSGPELPEPVARPDGLALLLLSGGSTGLPKLIPRTHDDYAYNIAVSADVCGFDAGVVYQAVLPVAHNFALGCPGVFGTLLRGGTVVLAGGTDAASLARSLDTHGATVTALVPSLAEQLTRHVEHGGTAPRALQLVQVGGARLRPESSRRMRAALRTRVQQVYGMAEGLLNFTRPDDPDDVVDETQGRPASPADEIRIVDADGRSVPAGEVGELWTRGPYTIAGYYGDTGRDSFDGDWYRTGDLVRLHPSGNLVVEGRIKDVINRDGEKVAAFEVEMLLARHPAIADVAVIALPAADGGAGEGICAFVTARPGQEAPVLHEARRFLDDQGVARFKLPDRVVELDALPTTAVGKPDKKALRDLLGPELPS
jgi:2,3-dihydroxybenzoate-AMP ligase